MYYRERKNVNLPGVIVDLPTLTSKDEEDLVKWGLPNDIDFIAASFVRKGSDVTNIRKVDQPLDEPLECHAQFLQGQQLHLVKQLLAFSIPYRRLCVSC